MTTISSANSLAKPLAIAMALLLSAGTAQANPGTGKAMTWAGYKLPPTVTTPGVVRVGCYNNCDAYKGDMPLSAKLPILCIVPGDSPIPSDYEAHAKAERPKDWKFYMGWSGGQVGLTKETFRGSDLTSRAFAKEQCVKQFGSTARMAEHHDNKTGGWSLGATMHSATSFKSLLKGASGGKKRFWVDIKNQPGATPW